MRLSEFLKPRNIRIPLIATEKESAIRELIDLLAGNGEVYDPARVLAAVLDREAVRTTGIGSGLAIPHGKTEGTDHLVMAVGKPARPIDFQSIDNKPVTLIWLVSSPPDKTTPHLNALATISRMMMAEDFRVTLGEATTPQEFYEAVVKQEAATA